VQIEYAKTVETVMHNLRRIGATNKDSQRSRHLSGIRRFERMLAAYDAYTTPSGVPVTWEVLTLLLERE
jgi:malonyl-CoA O-methyltransferase